MLSLVLVEHARKTRSGCRTTHHLVTGAVLQKQSD
jgi:hypothetical protein